ncbi:MAG TPA: PH domain-containing protein [Candidatus Deferrimicrobiaceae bacterium]|nr:PH domain-containing protein [Candidatus Deferrimicrobiaceae bacterium]
MTRYADRLLADGERIALRTRQHWLAPVIDGRVAWAILVAAIVLLLVTSQIREPEIARQLFNWLSLALLVIGLVWVGYILVAWYSQDYIVTNRRVLKVEGILNKRSADSSLEKINDAVLAQSILGRMFGFGDLDIMTANEQSVDHYRLLTNAQTFKKVMLDEKHRLEQEVFQVPAPPLRASAPMPPLAPAGAPAPVAVVATAAPAAASGDAGRAMSSDEITRALGDLADLRDRGAISPEEFEAKKQDLLGRL